MIDFSHIQKQTVSQGPRSARHLCLPKVSSEWDIFTDSITTGLTVQAKFKLKPVLILDTVGEWGKRGAGTLWWHIVWPLRLALVSSLDLCHRCWVVMTNETRSAAERAMTAGHFFAVSLFSTLPGLEIIISDYLPEIMWAKHYQMIRLFHLSTGGDHCSNPGLGCRPACCRYARKLTKLASSELKWKYVLTSCCNSCCDLF